LLTSLVLLIIGGGLPYFFVKRAKAKRLLLFEQQLGDALIIIGNCLKTGLSFQQAVNSISRDMPEPVSREFGRVAKEVQLGVTLETALENMVDRLGSKDFMLIAAAVLIQRQDGAICPRSNGISDTIRNASRSSPASRCYGVRRTSAERRADAGIYPGVLMLLNPS
jgi:tight adherence protein B